MLYHNMLCCQEYELHIEEGNLLYAGVDYEMILREAEKEADIVLWDGGNNDFFLSTHCHDLCSRRFA